MPYLCMHNNRVGNETIYIFYILHHDPKCCPSSSRQCGENLRESTKSAAAKDYSLAISEYSKLKGLYDTNKDNAGFVKILFEGGDLCYDANRYIEALDFYVKCLEASHQAKNPQMEVSCTGNIGMIYAMFGDYGKANIYYEKGFEASKS